MPVVKIIHTHKRKSNEEERKNGNKSDVAARADAYILRVKVVYNIQMRTDVMRLNGIFSFGTYQIWKPIWLEVFEVRANENTNERWNLWNRGWLHDNNN